MDRSMDEGVDCVSTLDPWDFKTTLIYADAPSAHERALVDLAFGSRGINRGINLSETAITPDDGFSDEHRQFKVRDPHRSGCWSRWTRVRVPSLTPRRHRDFRPSLEVLISFEASRRQSETPRRPSGTGSQTSV